MPNSETAVAALSADADETLLDAVGGLGDALDDLGDVVEGLASLGLGGFAAENSDRTRFLGRRNFFSRSFPLSAGESRFSKLLSPAWLQGYLGSSCPSFLTLGDWMGLMNLDSACALDFQDFPLGATM